MKSRPGATTGVQLPPPALPLPRLVAFTASCRRPLSPHHRPLRDGSEEGEGPVTVIQAGQFWRGKQKKKKKTVLPLGSGGGCQGLGGLSCSGRQRRRQTERQGFALLPSHSESWTESHHDKFL